MMPVNVDEGWRIYPASAFHQWATGGKPATRWQMDWIGRVSGNHDASLPVSPVNVCRGNSRQQCLCVGVFGRVKQRFPIGFFYDFSHVHHRDRVTHVLNNAKVVRNKYIRQSQFVLKPPQQIQDLRLDADI